ncbi:MAG: RluA family pseudouridine synthase [Patescibacteria group bacterium]
MEKKWLDKILKLEIIFESPDFLVINKPAGLIVHPIKNSISKEKTLIDLLLKNYPEIKTVGDEPKIRPGIVHRLDKDVSGLMIVARNQKAFEHFKREFLNKRVKKEYLALVHGQVKEEKKIITLPLIKNYGKTLPARSAPLEKIKESWTEYEVLKKFKDFSLLKIKTGTGRTNQIRVHLKSIGHPIVGDEKYKIKRQKIIKLFNKNTDSKRIFLHAYKLGFYDLDGQWQEFKIDLPEELEKFLWELTSNT